MPSMTEPTPAPATLVLFAAALASCATAGATRTAVESAPARSASGLEASVEASPIDGTPAAQGAPEHAAAGDDQALKQANNPLANMTAVNFQNYYVSELSGTDETANTFWARYAKPFSLGSSKWLMRASVPLSTVPTGMDDSESGLGDSNVFAAYLFDSGDPSVSYGVGPLLGIPTASEDELGSDVWSAGLAAVLYDAKSSLIQYGGLVTYQHGFAGSGDEDDVNLLAVQPFMFLQLGGGLYFRSAPIWGFDLESGNYAVPIGAGLGKIVKAGKTVFNFFLEPQYAILHDGPGQPEFQLFFGFNTQFLGG